MMQTQIIDLSAPPVYCRVQTDNLTIEGWVWTDAKIEAGMVVIQPSLKPMINPTATLFGLPFAAIRTITPLPEPVVTPEPYSHPLYGGWGFK